MKAYPTHIQKHDQSTLYVHWSDDRESYYNVVALRRACLCAQCVNEVTREPILRPEDVSETVRPLKVKSMGRYALAISWSDGHTSSIYSWEHLREIDDSN